MSLLLLEVKIPIHASWKPGDTLQLYTDEGDGSVDTTKPLLATPVPVFPNQERVLGYGAGPYGAGPYGDDTGQPQGGAGGYGDVPYGDGPYGDSVAYVSVWVEVTNVFATWLFTAEVTSGAGTVQTDSLVDVTVQLDGEDPEPPASFAFSRLTSGQMEFTIA